MVNLSKDIQFIIKLKNGDQLITDKSSSKWACGYTADFGRCGLDSLRDFCRVMKQYNCLYFAQVNNGVIASPFYPYHEIESIFSTDTA